MKYIRRTKLSDYIEDKTVNIGGDTDTLTDVPKAPNEALEIQLDDGTVFVILGYTRK